MSYASVADLVARYGEAELIQRTDRAGAGVIDAAVAQRALDDAAAEIDGHLAARYRLPLATVPPLLSRVACDIARYRLWEDLASEEVRKRYEDARRLLENLSRGTVSLGLPANLPEEARPGLSLAAARSGTAPVFDRAGTGGY